LVLGQRIDVISLKVNTLPTISQLNSERFVYYTNELNEIDNRTLWLSQEIALLSDKEDLIFTNVERIYSDQFDLQKTAWDIKYNTDVTVGTITNILMPDTGYTRLKVDDIGLQIATVKARLGITY
jgi:hypothetical protein